MINLLPPEYREQKTINIDKILVGVLIFSLILVPVSYSFKLILQTKQAEQKHQMVQAKLDKLKKETQKLNELEEKYQKTKQDLQKQIQIVGDEINCFAVLKELKAVVPKRNWIKTFNIQNHDSFTITGYALKRQGLREMIENLKRSPYFNDISIDFTNRKELSVSGYKKEAAINYRVSGIAGNNEGDKNGLE